MEDFLRGPLGKIGTLKAAKDIQGAFPTTAAGNQLAFCEGLFRCAEAMAAKDQKADAQAIYDELRTLKAAPHQVRTGALRGAILGGRVACMFREPQFAPKLIETLQEGASVRIGVLDPLGADLQPGAQLYPALLRGLARALTGCLEGAKNP